MTKVTKCDKSKKGGNYYMVTNVIICDKVDISVTKPIKFDKGDKE